MAKRNSAKTALWSQHGHPHEPGHVAHFLLCFKVRCSGSAFRPEARRACLPSRPVGWKRVVRTETKNQKQSTRRRSTAHRCQVTSLVRAPHYTWLIYLYSTVAVLSRGRFKCSHAYTHMGMVMLMGIDGRACTIADITPGPTMLAYWNGTGQPSEDTPAKGDGAVAASTHVVRARSGMQAKRIMRRAARCDGSRWPRAGVGVRGGYLQ